MAYTAPENKAALHGSAGRSVARLRKETHHGNFLPCRSNPRYHRLVHGRRRSSPRPEPWPSETTALYGPAPLRRCPKLCAATLLEVIEYGDALVVPGFHDAHLHYFHSRAVRCSPSGRALRGRKRGRCRGTAGAPGCPASCRLMAAYPRLARLLVESRRYAEPRVTGCGYCTAYPWPCTPGTAHALWLNGCALERLGIAEDGEWPAGGGCEQRCPTGGLTAASCARQRPWSSCRARA